MGPANDGRLGTLLDSNTVDGVVWSAPANRLVGWRVGYLKDNAPLGGEGYSSWFGRSYGLLGQGVWGLTVQDATHAGGGVGAAADLSLPLLPDQLDAYVVNAGVKMPKSPK
jgi:hypothetical protein